MRFAHRTLGQRVVLDAGGAVGRIRAELDRLEPRAVMVIGSERQAALMDALRPFFRVRGIEANWDAMEQTSDSMLVLTLAMVCPFDPLEKQALLEAGSPEDRASMLVTLLQMGARAGPQGDAPPSGRPS